MLTFALSIGLIAGLALAGLGVWLVALGAQGSTRVTFVGQTLDSTNVGVTAIFIGAVTLLFVVRRTLASIDLLATHESNRHVSSTPKPMTIAELAEAIRKLSNDQRQLLSLIDTVKSGIQVGDVLDHLKISRQEAVYRARDLRTQGLVEIATQTDQIFMLSDQVRNLKASDTGIVRRLIEDSM